MFLKGLALALVLVLPLGSDPRTAANTFAETYNVWVNSLSTPNPHLFNAKEAQSWKAVQKAWKVLNKSIKYE